MSSATSNPKAARFRVPISRRDIFFLIAVSGMYLLALWRSLRVLGTDFPIAFDLIWFAVFCIGSVFVAILFRESHRLLHGKIRVAFPRYADYWIATLPGYSFVVIMLLLLAAIDVLDLRPQAIFLYSSLLMTVFGLFIHQVKPKIALKERGIVIGPHFNLPWFFIRAVRFDPIDKIAELRVGRKGKLFRIRVPDEHSTEVEQILRENCKLLSQ